MDYGGGRMDGGGSSFDFHANMSKIPNLVQSMLNFENLGNVLAEVMKEVERLRQQSVTYDQFEALRTEYMEHSQACAHDRRMDMHPRLETLEGRMRSCLKLNDEVSQDGGVYFCERFTDPNGVAGALNEDAISDFSLLDGLKKRYDHYKNYRIKDMSDGLVLYFVRGFMVENRFFMTMSNSPDAAHNATASQQQQHRVYRLDGVDEKNGRDVFKFALPNEIAALHKLDLPAMNFRTIRIDGRETPVKMLTEIVYQNRFYQVFSVTNSGTSLQEMIEMLQQQNSFLQSDLEREIHSHTASQQRIDLLENRLQEAEETMAGRLMKHGLEPLQQQIQAVEHQQEVARARMQEVEARSDAFCLKSSVHPRVEELENNMRRVLNLGGESGPTTHIFCERPMVNGVPSAVPNDHCVTDPSSMEALHKRLAYYQQYRIKDPDGQVLFFSRGYSIDGRFFVSMFPAGATESFDTMRCYRLDRVDENGRDILKSATATEKAAVHEASRATFGERRQVWVDGQLVSAEVVTDIVCHERFYSVMAIGGSGGNTLQDALAALESSQISANQNVAAVAARVDDLDHSSVQPLRQLVHMLEERCDGMAGKEIGGRIESLEGQMSRVLKNKNDSSASSDGGGHVFCERGGRGEDTILTDPALTAGLSKRLNYYIAYRIKDLTDGAVLHFVKGFVIESMFFMTMCPKGADPGNPNNLRVYRLERVDENGRDIFKNALPDEKAAISRLEASQRHNQILFINGSPLQCTLLTDMVFQNRFYVAYSRPAMTVTLQEQVERLEANTEQAVTELQREVKTAASAVTMEHLEPLKQRVADVEHLARTGGALANDVQRLQDQTSFLQRKVEDDMVAQISPLQEQVKNLEEVAWENKQAVESFDARLAGYAFQSVVHPRLDTLEQQMRRVLTLEEDVTYKHDQSYIFTVRENEQSIVDQELLGRLRNRLDYYLKYRIKDLQDGSTRSFIKGFWLDDHFFMHMAAGSGDARYYRMHKNKQDTTNRDVYKNITDAEAQLIDKTDLGWSSKILQHQGSRVQCRVLTEMESDGVIYAVYLPSAKATLEDGVYNLEGTLKAVTHNTNTGLSMLRAQVATMHERLEQFAPEEGFDDDPPRSP